MESSVRNYADTWTQKATSLLTAQWLWLGLLGQSLVGVTVLVVSLGERLFTGTAERRRTSYTTMKTIVVRLIRLYHIHHVDESLCNYLRTTPNASHCVVSSTARRGTGAPGGRKLPQNHTPHRALLGA